MMAKIRDVIAQRRHKLFLKDLNRIFPRREYFNPPIVRWSTPGNCSHHDEILEHPEGINTELKYSNISILSK